MILYYEMQNIMKYINENYNRDMKKYRIYKILYYKMFNITECIIIL